ncbi:MAG: translation initiation factor IF-2 [Candidatus Aenigmarchaeota archaeon]|nr:translation initiation factor IF-2 [Candidatus Aenigmarchaeota archaeon]
MKIRSPITVLLGHVDAGKTTLADKIRGTAIATTMEPGFLTQATGCSLIPIDVIKEICGELLEKFKIELKIPGLLIIDCPGHAAFMGMRRRGGNISDIAILVVDITEGFQEQTDESLKILREFKTPFVVAATKIDKIAGWFPIKNVCFSDSFKKQSESTRDELEKKVYRLVTQLAERGFNSERFDRIEDFKKQVAIVPCSGITGEGIAELLAVLAGLVQQFLKERLEVSEVARGTVLEVKETVGFGTTIDVILYDGSVARGDYLIIGGKEPIVTRIRALLRPRPLQELRVEKQFESVNEISAAAGIKIAAPDLETVIAGSPIIAVKSEEEIEKAKRAVQKEIEEVEFVKHIEGVVLKTDTLGSLEAMIKLLTEEGVPIRKAEVGHVTKQDIIEVQNVSDSLRRVVLAFNVKPLEEAVILARDLKIEIFQNNVIYRLIEEYKKWCYQRKEGEIQEKLEKVTRPVKIKILKGFTFRVSKPMIVGIEVLAGVLRPGALMKKDGKIIDKIKEIQREGQTIKEAKKGDKVAISMEEPTMGRQVREGDILVSALSEDDIKTLKEVYEKLSDDEKELLTEL